jgi:hypothetical protein
MPDMALADIVRADMAPTLTRAQRLRQAFHQI